jgi:hypothetical protein
LPAENVAAGSVGRGSWVIAMPLHLERVAWMPSPPLAPDDGPIDMDHLQRMTLGDASLAALPADAGGAGAYAEGVGTRDRRIRRC